MSRSVDSVLVNRKLYFLGKFLSIMFKLCTVVISKGSYRALDSFRDFGMYLKEMIEHLMHIQLQNL